MIFRCAYQLANYKVLRMVGTPATRAEIAECATRLEKLGALPIRTVLLAFIIPVFVDCGKIDLA
jgi:hypothetical protein